MNILTVFTFENHSILKYVSQHLYSLKKSTRVHLVLKCFKFVIHLPFPRHNSVAYKIYWYDNYIS